MLTLDNIQKKITSMHHQEILYKKWDVRHRSKDFTDLYWLYYPNTDKYFFEGNPGFLYEYEHLDDMGRFPIVTVRDGYLGLVDFFISNPKPNKDFLTTLVIHKKYARLVPKAWEDQIALYTVQPRAEQTKKNKKLIVHGYGVVENFLKLTPEKLASYIQEKTKNYSDVVFLCPSKYSALKPKELNAKGYDFLFMVELFKAFGHEIQLEDDTNRYINLLNETEFDFLNIDLDKFFIADNYVDHYLLSSGGQILNEEIAPSENSFEYNLSLNHKIVIEEFEYKKELDLFKQIFIDYKMSGMPKQCSIFKVLKSEDLVRHFLANF